MTDIGLKRFLSFPCKRDRNRKKKQKKISNFILQIVENKHNHKKVLVRAFI